MQYISSREGTLAELSESALKDICAGTNALLTITGRLRGAEQGKRIMQTSIPGVGIRVAFLDEENNGGRYFSFVPFSYQKRTKSGEKLSLSSIKIKIELIKTGEIDATGIRAFFQPAMLTFSGEKHLLVNLHQWIAFPNAVCNFSSTQVITALHSTSISHVKDTERVQFPVNIDCTHSGGMVALRVEGVAAEGFDDILAPLLSPGSAEGLGVRFWYHGHPVRLNSPFLIGFPEEWHANHLQALMSIGYEMTKSKVHPGTFAAVAALHIDYL